MKDIMEGHRLVVTFSFWFNIINFLHKLNIWWENSSLTVFGPIVCEDGNKSSQPFLIPVMDLNSQFEGNILVVNKHFKLSEVTVYKNNLDSFNIFCFLFR